MTVRSIITPSIIFAAGSIASAANAATTVETDYRPTVEGTPITLAGGVGLRGAPQFTFDDNSDGETFKAQIRATDADTSAGVFYQGDSTTLAASDDPLFVNRAANTDKFNGGSNGNYALRFTGGSTLYTGYATVVNDGVNDGALIDSITFEAAAVPAVPEPSTWAMMILGLGLVGAEMRRRRRRDSRPAAYAFA